MNGSLYRPAPAETTATEERLINLQNRINEQLAMGAALQAIGDRKGFRRCKLNASKLSDEAVALRASLRRAGR